ncbi:MAG: transglycosylase SLT domain-containing protein, partial [Pseudomonadota bacterium]
MHRRLLLIVLLFLATHATARVQEADLDGAWQRFMDTAGTSEPGMTFPHATCFNVAALEYGLPKTLLLAVARGESDFDVTARSRANAHGVMQI